ncbi:MAG TPA: hypothetical protein DGD08_13960 [Gemmatimonas aurantiaca]|nr:hypothetical protein [Gemmatimonas aurantiaca]HCT58304.1 hypothetical protein [Gemmatimonas aurantiaca]
MISRLVVLTSIGAVALASALPAVAWHPWKSGLPSTRRIQSLTIDTRSVNPGASIARDQCFTFAFDGAVASSCGDLRVTHALPATRVRGKAQAPMLVYHAQHAHPYPVVRANVTMPSGTVSAATATLHLVVNGTPTTVATQTYTGTQLPGGSTRRVALTFDGITYPTGVYPYTLSLSATVNGTVVQTQSIDTLVIVNRSTSEFGAGWWLARFPSSTGSRTPSPVPTPSGVQRSATRTFAR